MRERGRRVAAVGLGLAMVATFWTPPATAAVAKVKAKDNVFKPKKMTVAKGTRVKWVNRGQATHTTTSNNGVWNATLAPGESFKRKFRKKGTFRYVCTIHDGMRGRVVVV